MIVTWEHAPLDTSSGRVDPFCMATVSVVDDELVTRAPHLRRRVVFLSGVAHDPAVHEPLEQRGVPLIHKLDDLTIVLDAVRLALLQADPR